MDSELKAYNVTHLEGNSRIDTVVISTSRLKASTHCEGEILNVCEGMDIVEGQIVSYSSWNIHGWSGGFDTSVKPEWIEYLKKINLNNGEDD